MKTKNSATLYTDTTPLLSSKSSSNYQTLSIKSAKQTNTSIQTNFLSLINYLRPTSLTKKKTTIESKKSQSAPQTQLPINSTLFVALSTDSTSPILKKRTQEVASKINKIPKINAEIRQQLAQHGLDYILENIENIENVENVENVELLDAISDLGVFCLNNKYKQLGIQYLKYAESKNHANSAFELGQFYLNDKEMDCEYALELLERAASLGHYDAETLLKSIFNINDLKYEPKTEVENPSSERIDMYFNVALTHCSIKETIEHLNVQACQQNNETAALVLADMCKNGTFVEKNHKKSLFYYGKAAGLGSKKACSEIAKIYQYGSNDIPSNTTYANEWYKLAKTL